MSAAVLGVPAEAARPWWVQVESTLVNGEDDVMSPEPGEVVWASNAEQASEQIKAREYDTNLLLTRPATEAEVREQIAAEVLGPVREVMDKAYAINVGVYSPEVRYVVSRDRLRAAIRLVQPDHLTPMGARIIEQALGGDTDD